MGSRRADPKRRAQVVALRKSGHSITRTAELAGCSPSQVKRIWAAEVSQAEAARMGAFREDALTEADALAAADQEGTKARRHEKWTLRPAPASGRAASRP